ncbi:hypothetical protein AB0I60_35475 [Actinosynnema sp. NPDC050436]|uniref:hypothetical protein n=1 Tax=Actinosynnema sp. NPDC050436 TaxID=3155659 RepID=UPI0033C5B333
MADAGTIVSGFDIPVEQHVENNQFVIAAREGKLGKDQLRRLLQLEFQTQELEFSAYPLLAIRFRHEVPASLFVYVADRVLKARRLLVGEVAPVVGWDVGELRRAPLTPATQEAATFLAWMGLQAGAGEAALVARADFTLWTATCAELVRVLDGSDVPAELLNYLREYSEPPPEVVEAATDVVEWALASGEDPERITRSAPGVEPLLAKLWRFAAEG